MESYGDSILTSVRLFTYIHISSWTALFQLSCAASVALYASPLILPVAYRFILLKCAVVKGKAPIYRSSFLAWYRSWPNPKARMDDGGGRSLHEQAAHWVERCRGWGDASPCCWSPFRSCIYPGPLIATVEQLVCISAAGPWQWSNLDIGHLSLVCCCAGECAEELYSSNKVRTCPWMNTNHETACIAGHNTYLLYLS